ncbi:MAG: TRAP transporter small permease subunit [bacterium]|nr:TRAP transporter small permease subunit [bacterium]
MLEGASSSRLVRVLEPVCAGLLGLLTLNAAFELFAWTLWRRSFAAIEEIQGVLVVWLALLAAAYCLAEGLHLAVDLVARSLPARWQPTLARAPGVANAAFGVLLAIYGARLVLAVQNTLPGTGWSASVHYQPAVVAGGLIAWLGLQQAISGASGASARPADAALPPVE